VLAEADVRTLAERLIADLRGPLEAPDGVFGRSCSALVLASIVARDAAAAFLARPIGARSSRRPGPTPTGRPICAGPPARAVGHTRPPIQRTCSPSS
jgi:hypothetical protein